MSLKRNRFGVFTGFLSATVMAALVVLSVPAVQARERVDAWIVSQKHCDLGNIKVYLAKDAVKIELEKLGCSLLSKAPDWKVYYFRPGEKTVWIGTPEKLAFGTLGNPYCRPTPVSKLPVLVLKPGQKNVFGKAYQVVELLGSGQNAGLHYEEYSAMLPAGRHKVFWVTRDINVSPRCAQVMCRLYGLPEMNLVPLYVRENTLKSELYSTEHEKNRMLPFFPRHIIPNDLRSGPRISILTAASRRAPVADDIFQVPLGYERKKDILDVTYSKEAKDELTKVIDSVGYVNGSRDKSVTPSSAPPKILP